MSIAPGTKIGRYEIRSKLGQGGMGEVYLAEDTRMRRNVALKILPHDVAADRVRMERFVQEAKTASGLNHPNIITIYEIDQADDIHFIAIEFIDGQTLRARATQKHMTTVEVIDVAIQAANGLAEAHGAGIVHRDIKPDNIMIRRDGIVKVLDFGLAKLTEAIAPHAVDSEAPTSIAKTEPGTVIGTAVYMSPEQARGLPLDPRTDIFSFGVVIYELVAGRLPFKGSDRLDVLASILSDDVPPPLARYAPDAPPELDQIVQKALRKQREQRYESAKDLLADLRDLKRRIEIEAEMERTRPPQELSEHMATEVTVVNRTVPPASVGTQPVAVATSLPKTSGGLLDQIRPHKRVVLIVSR